MQHVSLTIAVALVFNTDLDSPLGPTFGTEEPAALKQYNDDIDARKLYYDLALALTFVACVPGCVQRPAPELSTS